MNSTSHRSIQIIAPAAQRRQESDRSQLLAAIAEAYYIDGLGQADIAERFGCNRSAISRVLAEARAAGIVEIKVRREFSHDLQLSNQLTKLGGRTRVHVLRSSSLPDDAVSDLIASWAAQLVYSQLTDTSILAVTLGTMVHRIARALALLPPINIDVVQMCGSVGSSELGLDGHATVRLLSSAYNCRSTFLHAPFLVENREMLASLIRNAGNQECIDKCLRATAAIVGLGTLDPKVSSLARGGHVSLRVMSALSERGAVGDVGGYMINERGELVVSGEYIPVCAIEMDAFCRVPIRVGAATGLSKGDIVAAAVRGGMLTDLVTDSETAMAATKLL
ncbi:sugar-binding domain-containing protein [Mesorhizobium sp. M1403]|uniref:sugar-binding transcriptional regulator n=1 Tax=Mesorhizobium sp. M1403 TaxID=2957097 RepID=UPI00333ACAC2